MLEFSTVEIAYKCDRCGKLFYSPDDAQNHNKMAHNKSVPVDGVESWVVGTTAPAGNSEQEKAM